MCAFMLTLLFYVCCSCSYYCFPSIELSLIYSRVCWACMRFIWGREATFLISYTQWLMSIKWGKENLPTLLDGAFYCLPPFIQPLPPPTCHTPPHLCCVNKSTTLISQKAQTWVYTNMKTSYDRFMKRSPWQNWWMMSPIRRWKTPFAFRLTRL